MIRFRLDDLLKGSTDFEVIHQCKSAGWQVFIRLDLHAKTYIIDDKRGIIGSANTTVSGFNISESGNYEMAALVDIDKRDIDRIKRLFDESVLVTDDLEERLSAEYSSISSVTEGNDHLEWSPGLLSDYKPDVSMVFSYEFPEKDRYYPGDYIPFLETTYIDLQQLKKDFKKSTAYRWLHTKLVDNNGVLFFGELSRLLHNDLVEDPKPYRRDVKILVHNLLCFIETICFDEIKVDRPNHSQRVTLQNGNLSTMSKYI